MLDLARAVRLARSASVAGALALVSVGALTGCDSCAGQAKRFATEQGATYTAKKTNEQFADIAISAPGETTKVRADDGSIGEARVTKDLPPRWPEDMPRPAHAVLLKGVDMLASDGTSGAGMFALYESTDSHEEVEAFFRRAGASNPLDRVPPESRPRRMPVLVIAAAEPADGQPPRWAGFVFLSESSKGRTLIGIQIVHFREVLEKLKPELMKMFADAGMPLPDEKAAPPAAVEDVGAAPRRGEVTLGTATVKSGSVRDTDRELAGLRPRLRQCYERDNATVGSLVVDIKVLSSGNVASVDVVKNDGVAPATADCVTKVLQRPQFWVSSTSAEIEVPISFGPAGSTAPADASNAPENVAPSPGGRPAPDRHDGVDLTIGETRRKTGFVPDADNVIVSLRARLLECYAGDSPTSIHEAGSLALSITVLPSGEVGSLNVTENQRIAPKAVGCITKVLKAQRFSAPTPQWPATKAAPAVIELPLAFAPLA